MNGREKTRKHESDAQVKIKKEKKNCEALPANLEGREKMILSEGRLSR